MTDKYSLVTGATSGIGFAFSKILLKDYNLILVGRNKINLQQTKEKLLSEKLHTGDKKIITLAYDLSDPTSVTNIFLELDKSNIHVDVLINNAGSGLFGAHTALSNDSIIEMINLNVTSLTLLCNLFGSKMKNMRSGYILNVASLAAYQPVPYLSAYAASKSYVLNFSEAIAKEFEDYGVTVTCISPGHTNTNFFKAAGIGDRQNGFYGLKTRVSPDFVARIGLKALFAGKLSVLPGAKNNFLANLNRFCSRSMTAKISKFLTRNEILSNQSSN